MPAVRLLADIGLRALSPAVNDPATAVDAIDATEGLLRALAVRELWVGDLADLDGVRRVRLVLPTWDFLRTGVEDLLPAAAPVPMVLERMQRLLTDLLEMSSPPRHAALIRLSDQVRARLAACHAAAAKDMRPAPPLPWSSDSARADGTGRVATDQS